jgi:hypothetical protein
MSIIEQLKYSDYKFQVSKSKIQTPRLKISSLKKLIFPFSPWVLGFGI